MIAIDRETLSAIFESRIKLAKMTQAQAVLEASGEWVRTQSWIRSPSKQEGSFLWFCNEFDLAADAVRTAIEGVVVRGKHP